MDTRQVALRALTRNTRWVVLDIETTPSDDGQHVVSIGINQWRMDATAEQRTPAPVEWFVDPDVPIENTRVHHITAKTLSDNRAEPFAFYIDRLNAVLKPRLGEKVVRSRCPVPGCLVTPRLSAAQLRAMSARLSCAAGHAAAPPAVAVHWVR